MTWYLLSCVAVAGCGFLFGYSFGFMKGRDLGFGDCLHVVHKIIHRSKKDGAPKNGKEKV